MAKSSRLIHYIISISSIITFVWVYPSHAQEHPLEIQSNYSLPKSISNPSFQQPLPNLQLTQRTLESEPNEDRFLQPTPLPQPLPTEEERETPEVEPTEPEVPAIQPSEATIPVQTIEVIGSTVFEREDFADILQPLQGQTVSVTQLQLAADAITQRYLNQGYITSRAIVVEESIPSQNIEIRVIEGQLEEIQVQGAERLNPDYVRSRIRLGADVPLNSADLEDQLRLLKQDPLFDNVEASLQAGSSLGQSILEVRVIEANPFFGIASLDNYSPPSVGSIRAGIDLNHLNVFGIGDRARAAFYVTEEFGAENLDLTYSVPVNAMNGIVQARTVFTWTEVVDGQFEDLNIEGDSQLYELSYRQPFIRTPREEFTLSAGFAYQNGQTFLDGSPFPFLTGAEDGETTTSVFKFGQEYIYRQVSGAWAIRSLFNIGTSLFDATDNDTAPDSEFLSWLGQIQRVQVISQDNFLIVEANLQLSTDALLPSQQFVIGGGRSVRGYRQNARAADNGFRFSVEDRITLKRNESGVSTLQLAPFFDAGVVWNHDDNPNGLQDQTFLAGLGVGVIWQPLPALNLRVDYGYPFIDLDDEGDNIQDDGLYFSVNYFF